MNPTPSPPPTQGDVLRMVSWQEEAERHFERARRWTVPTLARRARGIPHPVHDFLFTYYFLSMNKLEQWHPRFREAVVPSEGMPEWLHQSPYRESGGLQFADASELDQKAIGRIQWIHDLLVATRSRTPSFACHGLHEWAMIYSGEEIRHREACPLRLSQEEIDEVVRSRPLICTHFDAFRFFHPRAQLMNHLEPTLGDRQGNEQPGCVHANMDLYKWAAKCMPWVGSDLLMDCFELAIDLRELDMRASPYDLREYGLEPVPIENHDGRREYEKQQRILAERSRPHRDALIEVLGRLLVAVGRHPPQA